MKNALSFVSLSGVFVGKMRPMFSFFPDDILKCDSTKKILHFHFFILFLPSYLFILFISKTSNAELGVGHFRVRSDHESKHFDAVPISTQWAMK